MKVVRLTAIVGLTHAARMRALARVPSVDVEVIQVTSVRGSHDWKFDLDATGFRIHTLFDDREFKELSDSEITSAALAKLDEVRPDVCVIGGYSNSYLRAAAKWCRAKEVLSVLVTDSHFFTGRHRWWWREKLKGLLIRNLFDAVFVSAEKARLYQRMLAFEDVPIVKGFNAVDNDYFERESAKARTHADELKQQYALPENYFVWVGRIAKEKNLERALRAYDLYRKHVSGKPWDLVLVGSGPQEEHLKKVCRKLGTEGIHWVGWRSYDELVIYYTFAKALLLLSVSETWGWTVNEAMLCGLPVVVSELCGTSELVSECENGFWCNPYNIKDMAYAMAQMTEYQDWQEMSDRSRELIKSYSPELWAKRLLYCIERAKLWREGQRCRFDRREKMRWVKNSVPGES